MADRKKIVWLLVGVGIFMLVNLNESWRAVLAAEDASDIQSKIDKYQNKLKATEQQLNTSQTQLDKNKSSLSITQQLISKTETELGRKEQEIKDLEKRVELNRKILAGYLLELYANGDDPVAEFVLSQENLNDIVTNADQMISIKGRLLETLSELKTSQNDLERSKAELADKKEDHEKLFSVQQGQQYEIKQDIQEAQATISELNARINKLKGELSSLLGKEVSFKNIMDAASFAAKVTGVRKDFLLGVLVVESNLGRYTGGCNFKESKMSGTRATIFKNICSDLKYNYNKMKVSCPPRGYKGTGGAMGVAQFMPDTWVGYKNSIASVTGHNPPDPWSLTDGVVAMALKLAKVSGVTAHKESAEAKAYCVYLAGGNWASYCDNKGTNYGEKVLYWADNYEKLMN